MDKFIHDLCQFSPRQGENEIKTAQYLIDYLSSRDISFLVQTFPTQIPLVKAANLKINGQEIPCLGSCLRSGKITSIDQINFDIHSDYLSTHTCTSEPSLYISRTHASLLNESAQIDGFVEVEKHSFESKNILIGNLENPKNILFAHYDCLGGGAIDNAAGVASLLDLITKNHELITPNLFVLVGNEELGYDKPNYWGKGYRQFEYKYPHLLKSCKQIIVIDGIGLTPPIDPPEFLDDPDNFFPIDKLERYQKKIKIVSSDQSEVLKCYHCFEDTPDKINPEFLNQSLEYIKNLLAPARIEPSL